MGIVVLEFMLILQNKELLLRTKWILLIIAQRTAYYKQRASFLLNDTNFKVALVKMDINNIKRCGPLFFGNLSE